MDYFLDIFVEKMYTYSVFIKYRWGKFMTPQIEQLVTPDRFVIILKEDNVAQ